MRELPPWKRWLTAHGLTWRLILPLALILTPMSFADAAPPTLRSVSSNAGTTSSFVIPKPAGLVLDDVMVAQITPRSQNVTITPPLGWTFIRRDSQNDGVSQALYYKVAGGGEPPSYTWILGSSQSVSGAIAAYSGVDTGSPINAHDGRSSGVSTSVPTPSITTTVADTRLIAFFGIRKDVTFTPPGSMTERWDINAGAGDTVSSSGADETFVVPGVTGTRTATASQSEANIGQLIALAPAASSSVSGTVFEDVNYGGGAGRDLATASGIARSGARVELYDATGTYVSFTTTDGSGNYSFPGLAAANHTVRVVNSTVTSSRTGYVASLRSVQTYRTDASSGSAVPDTARVGGQDPSVADAGNGSAGAVMNTTTGVFTAIVTGTAQSITNVALGGSDINGVDFGYNFDTTVNTNDTSQGSLRQFLTNANTLGGDASLAQSGRPAGIENALFMISNGTAAAGLRAANNYFVGGAATISPTSALPPLSTAMILDAQRQPGWILAPIVELNGTGAATGGLVLDSGSGGSVVRGLVINRFGVDGILLTTGSNGNTIAGNYIGTSVSGNTDLGNVDDGLEISSNDNVIGGLALVDRNVISGNGDEGVDLNSGATGNVIRGNIIGLNALGNATIGNSGHGIQTEGATNVIGGSVAGSRNVISANALSGVHLFGPSATGVLVQGNYLGTDINGTAQLGNGDSGVRFTAGAANNTIGGTVPAARNVISGNTDGIYMEDTGTTGNVIQGNYIGTDVTGALDRGNTATGVYIVGSASSNTIGGSSTGAGNVISGNDNRGIDINGSGTNDNLVFGNYIGTNATGTTAVANSSEGIVIRNTATGNVIGGVAAGAGNVVSGNTQAGIRIQSSNNTVFANFIGTDVAGTIMLGNQNDGVRVLSGGAGNRIGDASVAGSGNLIAYNAGHGVDIEADTGNLVQLNSIHSNTRLGINLTAGGEITPFVTPNDGVKTAGQPNLLMDHPVFTSAALGGTTLTVAGYVGSAPGQPLFASARVEVFESDNDPTGFGEGITYLGFLTTDASGNFSGSIDVTGMGLVVGENISGTATDGTSNTSEFGANVTVTATIAISGTVYEDVNFGGGAGRDQATASGVARSGARVELYDATGTYVTFTTTDGSGNYSFPGLASANHTVRVVNSTVTSSRTGYLASLRGVQTYRTDASSGSAVAETARVGGQDPSVADAGNGSAGAIMNTTTGVFTAVVTGTAQSITNVALGASDISGVEFGFNFDTIVNTNNAGQGSLRQLLTNANTLGGDASLAQAGLPAGIENANFMISNGTAAPGLRAANNYFVGGVATIGPTSALPPISTPMVLDAQRQPGWTLAPIVELNGAGAGATVDGLVLESGGDASTIRGIRINRFTRDGLVIQLGADNITVASNWIGSDGSGAAAMGNGRNGIELLGADATIGGTNVADRNVINNNGNEGINLTGTGATGNTISANYIGLEADGTSGSGNGDVGIAILTGASGNTIGGLTVPERNVISMNVEGIEIRSPNNIVVGNYIGTDAAGTLNRGNHSDDGIEILAGGNNNQIGGIATEAANLIAFSQRNGVNLQAGTNNLVLGNRIHSNILLGIDLGNDAVTANNGTKSGALPNFGMDQPVFTSAILSGTTLTLAGYVGSAVGQPLFANARVEVFESDNDPSGFGEGITYLGFLTTDASGNFSGSIDVTGMGLVVGENISGTATDGTNNTSEFGATTTVVTNNTDLVITKVLDPSTPGPFAEGGAVTYLLTVTNNGPAQATNVTTTDTYPAELTLGAPVPSAPTTYVAGTGVWTIGTLNNGASATLTLPGIVNASTAGDAVTNSVTVASGDQADPTIVGDDLEETFTVLPFLSIDDIVQAETNAPGTTTFTFTVSINQAIGSDVTFDIDTADNTATVADSDYAAIASASGTILAGDTSTTIDVTVNGDDNIEADETFFVDISNVVAAAVVDGRGQGTITNDDSATVSVAGTINANEAGSVDGQFTVTQSTISDTDTIVSYSIAGTATATTDYTALSGTVTVLAGATTATIDVAGIVDDVLFEGPETVIVTLTGTNNGAITPAPSPADTATVTILDNNGATVSIAATTDGNEAGSVNGLFTVTQSEVSVTNTDISYSIAGTATATTDYTALSGTVTVLAGATTASIDVTGIVADALVEGSETVIVTLTGTDNTDITVAASPNDTATVNILDNNAATVSIAATTDGNEAGPANGLFTITQTATSVSNTVITYSIAGTATAGGTDYATLSGSVTVLAGDTTATIDVTGIIDDALVEGAETVIVTLTGTDNVAVAVAASPADTATVNILDNNAATVSIAATTVGNEAGPVDGQFTVTQSMTSATDTVITYGVAGTATATTDYVALTGTVTVLAGDTTATIDVTGIVADALVEGTETVIVTLTATDNPGIAVAASPADTATVNILDNNAATVSIVATTDANEAGPVDGQLTVTQSATSASDTVITYTVAGTATATTDYTVLTGTVTIPNGATTATIDITGIIADALVEGTETVIVTLTATDNPGVTIATSPADTATVNILDSTGATVSIAPTTNGAETGPADAEFTVTQSAIAVNDTVISYAVGGTATSGSDYAALGGTVTIAGGAASATIIVPVIDDVDAEGIAETVAVTLSSISASDPGIIIAASPDDNATITIADNDSDLITTKTVNNATPVEGGTIIYTISVTNSAGVQATNVSLTDMLPAGVTYVSDDSGGAYNSSTGIWSIGTLDTLAPTNVATLNIDAIVDVGASALAQPITNTTTTAVGDQADPDTSTDTLTASITVDNNADLVTTKTVDNASPVENATITYMLSVLNNGTAQATNVSLIDLLPAGVTYVSDDGGGTYNPVTGVWTLGTLNNGAIQSLNISATVDMGANALTQPITNITTAAVGDQLDPDVTTDDLTADIMINYNADLLTTKIVDNATPLVGDTIIYTLTVTNNGPAPATNVSLTDSLPVGVTYASDDSVGAYDNATGVWTVGDLANGASATLNISASVDAGAGLLPQPITNTTTAAVGDQIDPDTTIDDLAESINVSLIDPTLIQLTKTVGRNRASAGEIVAYSIELRNSTAVPIGSVRLSDSPARGFKYVPGTAQLDGLTIADPTVGLPMVFDIGTVPGFVDGNGNGIADPGEPGYVVFSYRMVAGSGVAPGVWSNTAVATISCDTCFVSNTANADIEIIEDTLFDLGTVIGKVFYDADGDGWQDSGEAGIAAAMVALDDGSYALTDEFGRYHFPAVKPGQRLLKINLNSLVGRATATNDKTRIVSVTPGLMAKVNFGVIIETVDAAIGAPGQLGVPVDSETIHPPLLVNGSNLMPSLLVNGEPVSLAKADISLGARQLQDVVELDSGKLKKPIQFRTEVSAESTIEKWRLIVSGSRGEIAYTRDGNGLPPPLIEWNGIRENGRLIGGGRIYTYYLTLTTGNGQSASSSRQLFGVNRKNTISLNLAGGAFVTGSHQLTRKAEVLLSETANAIRAYPDEIVVISGHTDSVGSEISNMKLAERRARAAYDYLHTTEGLPEEQFIVQAFGESRPIATNDTAWGRELNRRVEISGDIESIDRAKNYDPYSQRPVVRINDTMVEVDESGSFRTEIELDAEQEVMGVLLSTPRGRSVETVVQLPTLQIMSPQGRFAIPVGADIPERRNFDATSADNIVLTTELQARTEPGNSVEFNGKPVEVNADGLFSAPITLRAGDNYFGLVARNPMGMLRIANLKLTVDASSIDAPEIVVDPIPQLALQLPPPGIPMTNSNLVIPGFTLPGNRVFINDNEISVDADGRFMATVELRLGENPFTARVVDIDGYAGEIEQTFAYDGNPMFFMALVDGTFSQLQTSGSLQAAGTDKSNETVTEGRVAYYLKGHVLGKYLLTSAFDSGQHELGELFSDLTAQDNDRLLTNLDPYTLYPVYGDASTVVYDAQSQSKFYLALESDTVTALIGNYALNFTDTELASYQRTLFGGSATYQSVAKDESGDHKTKAQAFYANIAQAHVRDEMRATGGSLYYLSQREVIEGSEHVSIIVRDQDSGLILTRSALQQGLDYNIDYVDGRLLTNRPISSFSPDTSLIDSDPLGGSAVYVQIDYETALNGFEQTATGARLRQAIGRNLAVGVTSVDEDQLGGQYSLKAADAEYRLGLHSRLVAEYADSAGNNSTVNISDDGGLTYQAVAQSSGNSGNAYKIAAEIDAGELFGQYDRLLLNTYFKHLDSGFSASSVTSEQGSEKSGIGAILKISDTSSLLGRYEQQTQLGTGSENMLATLQWNLIRKIWGVAVELEDRAGFAGDATLAAARINYRWTDTLSTTLEHQQTLQGLVNDQSTAGVAYRATEKLILDASATHGTTGDSAQLGAQLDWRGNRLYMGQQFNDVIASGASNNRLVGIEAPFGPEGVVYSEYRWSDLSLGRQQQAMFGARQRFQASDNLQIQLSGEHSAQKDSNSDPGERYALSVGATFANDSGITLSTRNEYRKDSRSIASEQFLSTSNVEMALGDNLAVLGKYRFSKSESSPQIDRDIDFTEASIGLAYRPVEHDRLNLLARYTRLSNTPTEFQLASISTGMGSDIFAVDWSYQLSQRIEWVGKQALRWSENGADTTDLKSQTALTVQRLNWSLPRKFLLGTEYRMMSQDVANDRRDGFVTELMWEGFDPLRLGVGYNFSNVSDNDYADYDFKTRGIFLRVQGKF